MKQLNSAFNLLSGFNGEAPSAEVCLDVKYDFANPQVNGRTIEGNPIKIQLNGNRFSNRNELEVARTLFHELIHAEMYRKIQSVGGRENLNIDNFPGLFDYYSRYFKVRQRNGTWHYPNGTPQHNLMAEHYIGFITDALMEYDGVAKQDQQLRSLYEALAWMGLEITTVWESKSDHEKQTIENQQRQIRQGRSGCN